MERKISNKKWTIAGVLIVMTASLGYCASPDKIGGEAGGTVIDVSTNLPIEGAYVMSIYYESAGTVAGRSSWCVKTKGMYTGKDGKFHFPLENSRFLYVHAIKPDYFSSFRVGPMRMERLWYGVEREIYDPNIYLKPQDPAKPDFHLGNMECERPKTREDVLANIEYLKLTLTEHVKYGVSQQGIEGTREQIRRLESMPVSQKR